jgi:ABC-type transporter Mla subunit MlaD
MVKGIITSIVLIVLLFWGAYAMTAYFVGYSRGGRYYITKHRDSRKSLRVGSPYYYGPHFGTGGVGHGK